MSAHAPHMEKAWSATFIPGDENTDALHRLFEAKAHWEALGLQFPMQFFAPRLSGGLEDRTAFQVHMTIASLLGEARRTVQTSIVITDICQDGMPEAAPSFTMNAEFAFVDSACEESGTGG